MAIGHWITLGIFAISQIGVIIAIYVNTKVKIKELEMDIVAIKKEIQDNKHSFHIHEEQNEKTFNKLEKKLDNGFKDTQKAISDLMTTIINKLNQQS